MLHYTDLTTGSTIVLTQPGLKKKVKNGNGNGFRAAICTKHRSCLGAHLVSRTAAMMAGAYLMLLVIYNHGTG